MAWTSFRWTFAVAAAAAAAACGPEVNAPDGASTTEGTGASSEGGDTAGRPDLGGGEVDSTAAPFDCRELGNEAREGNPVAIEIHNVGDEPLLLDAPCFGYDYLRLSSASGWGWPGGFCSTTCEEELQSGCWDCDGCAISAYTVVNPGESHEVRWPGVLYETVTPPLECWQAEMCNDTCARLRLPTADPITVSVEAITHADCLAMEADPAVCDCPAPGRCEGYGQAKITPTLAATVDFDPQAAEPVVIELEG